MGHDAIHVSQSPGQVATDETYRLGPEILQFLGHLHFFDLTLPIVLDLAVVVHTGGAILLLESLKPGEEFLHLS
jgi:hypothetical protein